MAITVDVQPPYASSTLISVTSGSFTPTAGSLLVACVAIANGNGIAGAGSTVITDTGSHTWTLLKRQQNSGAATAEIWCADNASTSAITVTATSQITGQTDLCIQVISYNGAAAAASQTGATAGGTNGTVAITTTKTGSQVLIPTGEDSAPNTLVAFDSNTTLIGQNNGALGDTLGVMRATNLTGTPGSITLGDQEGTTAGQATAAVEIVPAVAVAGNSTFPGKWPGTFAPGINGGKLEQLYSFQLLGDRSTSGVAAQTINVAGIQSPDRISSATISATANVNPAGVTSPNKPGAVTVLGTISAN